MVDLPWLSDCQEVAIGAVPVFLRYFDFVYFPSESQGVFLGNRVLCIALVGAVKFQVVRAGVLWCAYPLLVCCVFWGSLGL